MSERSKASGDEQSVDIRIEFSHENLPTPIGANYFHLSTHGPEVQLLVGFVDLYQVHRVAAAAREGRELEPTTLTPQISHRFLLSQLGLKLLKDQIGQVVAQMEELKRKRQSRSPTESGSETPA